MNNYTYTVAAISTPPGKGGVAIIRLSGDDALEILSRVFIPRGKKSIEDYPPRMQIRGDILHEGDFIDDGMATYFKAPSSYTGEDVCEISCHGGVLVTSAVLEALIANGAHMAEPGEFTRRAFINGKLSLTEAEAIGNLLEAESREQIRLASSRSRGLLSGKIEELRASLTSLLSSIYARIDYPDEDLGDFTDEETAERLIEIKKEAAALLSTYRTGKAINEGIRTVICGKTNVGKSSLYNLLLGYDAAIVTEIEGTTRDVLSDKISLGRVLLRLSDTAGVRKNTPDLVEKLGIERTRREISESELIFAVFDLSREFDCEDGEILKEIENIDCAKIAILNKSDMQEIFDRKRLDGIFDKTVTVSAKGDRTATLREITDAVGSLFTDEKISVGEQAIISSARQNAELLSAIEAIDSAIFAYQSGLPTDCASSDIEKALGAIAELDGKAISDEVVADIFSKFCVGK